MILYTVRFSEAALRDLKRLEQSGQKKLAVRCYEACEALVSGHSSAVRKIKGTDNVYRLRVGDYRAVFSLNNADRIVFIEYVAHRKDVYRP